VTPADTADLLAFAAAFDQRTIGRADVAAWHAVLGDLDLTQARQAVAQHYASETRRVMPADIRAAVRARRSDTAADFVGPGLPATVPDADPDDVPAYLAALREQRTRAADGQQLVARPVAALLAGVGRRVPAEQAPVRRPGPLGISCPQCSAPIGRPCRLPDGKKRPLPHPARRRAAMGQPGSTDGAAS
jgi:hypothetical protein